MRVPETQREQIWVHADVRIPLGGHAPILHHWTEGLGFRSVGLLEGAVNMGNGIRNGYEDIEEINDPDGVVGVISRRRSNGALSIALFKTFDRDGVKEKTNFLSARHFAGVRRVLDIAEARILKLEAAQTAVQR
jgi:hypothetical protein